MRAASRDATLCSSSTHLWRGECGVVGMRDSVAPPPPPLLAPAHVMARLTPAPSGPHDAAPASHKNIIEQSSMQETRSIIMHLSPRVMARLTPAPSGPHDAAPVNHKETVKHKSRCTKHG